MKYEIESFNFVNFAKMPYEKYEFTKCKIDKLIAPTEHIRYFVDLKECKVKEVYITGDFTRCYLRFISSTVDKIVRIVNTEIPDKVKEVSDFFCLPPFLIKGTELVVTRTNTELSMFWDELKKDKDVVVAKYYNKYYSFFSKSKVKRDDLYLTLREANKSGLVLDYSQLDIVYSTTNEDYVSLLKTRDAFSKEEEVFYRKEKILSTIYSLRDLFS